MRAFLWVPCAKCRARDGTRTVLPLLPRCVPVVFWSRPGVLLCGVLFPINWRLTKIRVASKREALPDPRPGAPWDAGSVWLFVKTAFLSRPWPFSSLFSKTGPFKIISSQGPEVV